MNLRRKLYRWLRQHGMERLPRTKTGLICWDCAKPYGRVLTAFVLCPGCQLRLRRKINNLSREECLQILEPFEVASGDFYE